MAIGPKDWRPVVSQPSLQIVRFSGELLTGGIEEHAIEGVKVRIYNPAKTIVDLFRYRQSAGKRYKTSPGLNIALEGLRAALRQRKATPAKIAEYAHGAGIWKGRAALSRRDDGGCLNQNATWAPRCARLLAPSRQRGQPFDFAAHALRLGTAALSTGAQQNTATASYLRVPCPS